MLRFPYKIHLTMPEQIAKSEINKTIMELRPSAYRVKNLGFIQFEWEYKTSMHRNNILPRIMDAMAGLSQEKYAITILDP